MILDSPPLARRDNPFLGLAYYSRNDADRFSGRDGEIEAVTNGILRTRTFVVYGRSGLGKTSLLQAGVFPRLLQEERNCLPIYVRTLEDPLLDLRRALVTQGKLDSRDPESSDLAQLIERASRDEQGGRDRLLVLVFDQFEEFFVRFADQPEPSGGLRQEEEVDRATRQRRVEQRIAFIEEMGRLAAAADLNLRLVFSLREDWIAEMDDFARAIPEIASHTFRLLPLTPFGVRQTVAATFRRAGIDFDAGLISALVEALAEVSFDPAVLQVMGSELWDRAKERSGDGPVRLEVKDLQDVGDVKRVFQGFLDQVSREIPEGELRRKIQTRAVLEALTTEKRTKRALSREALLEQYFAITSEELDKILERLYYHRLVRLDPRGESRWFELVHERLVELILRWLDSDLDFFKFRAARNLVRNSCSNAGWQQNPELLLNQGQLDGTVGPFKDLLLFNEEERLFLVSSAVYRQSRELTFWAHLAGYDVSADLLNDFLDQKDNEEVRQRAAEAASRFGDRTQHFAERCLDISLHDPSEAVRRSAARSFADLASLKDFQRLAVALAGKAERKPAIETLVEIIDKERLPKGGKFGFFRLRQARKKLYKRRLSTSREAIQERGIQGTVTGLRAGFVWMATAGLMLLQTVLIEIFPEKGVGEPSSFLFFGILGFFIVPLVGALVGSFASRKCAHDALRSGHEGRLWPALVVGGPRVLCLFILALWALTWGAIFLLKGLFKDSSDWLVLMLVTGACFWVPLNIFLSPALIAHWAWPDIRSTHRKYESWLWAWVWSFGGSFLLPLIAWSKPAARILANFASQPLTDGRMLPSQPIAIGCLASVLVMASVGGLVSFVGLMSLSRTFPRIGQVKFWPLGKLPQEPSSVNRRLRRSAGLVLLGTTGLLWFLAFRLDGLPFLTHRWFPQTAPHVRFGNGFIDTYHLNLKLPALKDSDPKSASPRLVRILFPADWHAFIWDHGEIPTGQVLSLSPGESHRLALQGERLNAVARTQPQAAIEKTLLEEFLKKQSDEYEFRPQDQPLESLAKNELRLEIDQPLKDLTNVGHPRLAVVRLNRRGNIWSGQLPALPPSMALSLSHTAQGGAWCRDMRFSLLLLGEGVEPVPISCQNDTWKVEFGSKLVQPNLQVKVEGWTANIALKPAASPYPGVLNKDGSWLATVSEDKLRVHLWSVGRSGEPISWKAPKSVKDISLSPDGRHVLMIFKGGGAQIGEAGGLTRRLPLPSSEISLSEFSRDSNYVWGVLGKSKLFAWKVDGSEAATFADVSSTGVDFDVDDAASKISIVDSKGALQVWEVKGRLLRVQENVARAWLSPKGDRLAIITRTGQARILNLAASDKHKVWDMPTRGKVYFIDFSPDGDRVVTATKDGGAKIWKVDSLEDPVVLEGSFGIDSYFSFSPDGKRIKENSEKDRFGRVWNVNAGGLPQLVPLSGELVSMRFAEKGRFVVLTKEGVVQILENYPPPGVGNLFLFVETHRVARNREHARP